MTVPCFVGWGGDLRKFEVIIDSAAELPRFYKFDGRYESLPHLDGFWPEYGLYDMTSTIPSLGAIILGSFIWLGLFMIVAAVVNLFMERRALNGALIFCWFVAGLTAIHLVRAIFVPTTMDEVITWIGALFLPYLLAMFFARKFNRETDKSSDVSGRAAMAYCQESGGHFLAELSRSFDSGFDLSQAETLAQSIDSLSVGQSGNWEYKVVKGGKTERLVVEAYKDEVDESELVFLSSPELAARISKQLKSFA